MFDSERFFKTFNRDNMFRVAGKYSAIALTIFIFNAIAFYLVRDVFNTEFFYDTSIYFVCGMVCKDVMDYLTKKRT